MARENTTGMRILIDKEIYKNLRIYCLQQNTTISDLLRHYVYSLLKTDINYNKLTS
jgi:hypothetical protein